MLVPSTTGINFFDTADMYSDGASEEVLGRALKDIGMTNTTSLNQRPTQHTIPSQSSSNIGVKRDEIVIATKVRSTSLSSQCLTCICRTSTHDHDRCIGQWEKFPIHLDYHENTLW